MASRKTPHLTETEPVLMLRLIALSTGQRGRYAFRTECVYQAAPVPEAEIHLLLNRSPACVCSHPCQRCAQRCRLIYSADSSLDSSSRIVRACATCANTVLHEACTLTTLSGQQADTAQHLVHQAVCVQQLVRQAVCAQGRCCVAEIYRRNFTTVHAVQCSAYDKYDSCVPLLLETVALPLHKDYGAMIAVCGIGFVAGIVTRKWCTTVSTLMHSTVLDIRFDTNSKQLSSANNSTTAVLLNQMFLFVEITFACRVSLQCLLKQ
eukprot:9082-Heterococcus_DN1.PRE.1